MKIETFRKAAASLLPLALILCLTTGCTAKARVERHLKRAETFYQAGEYEKAKIEYLNAVRGDPRNAVAFKRLGMIWLEQGAPLRAGPFLYRASELAPTDIEARLKLARAYLSLGAASDAGRQGATVLSQNPGHPEALVIVAESSRTPQEAAYLEAELQKATDRSNLHFQLAASTLALRKSDFPTAEAGLQRAAEMDPKSPLPHTGLATFYLFRKNLEKAEAELKTAAELTGMRSPERIRYAEFKASMGQVDQARAVVTEMIEKAPDFMPAYRLLAQTDLAEKKYDAALAVLERAFQVDPDNPDCRLVEVEIRMARGEGAKAAQVLERLDKAYPNTPMIRIQLARARVLDNDLPSAAGILNQIVTTNPDFTDAVLLLAEVNLRMSDFHSVMTSMQELLKKQPQLRRAEMLLAEAYRGLGQVDQAGDVYRAQINAAPESAQAYLALGQLMRQQKKLDEAQAAFEKALELEPNPATTDQLVDVQIERNDLTGALQTVERQLARSPNVAALHDVEGKIYASRQQWEQAEAAFSKAVQLDPNLTSAYDHLIALYIATNRLPEAAARLEILAAKPPANPAVLMIMGLVYFRLNDFPKARDAYEKLLALRPDFAPALNNLAYIYSERLPQLDRAAELARKARAQQPGDPAVADTLGWIVYKQGDYQQAVTLLQEAASKLTHVPEVQFHFGMASYMMGQTETARSALRKAVEGPGDFPGKEEAQQRLALLASGAGAPPPGAARGRDAQMANQSEDVVSLVRAGETAEQQGDIPKAAESYEKALKVNPKLLPPTLKLAEFYAGPLQNKTKALEYGKKARELAPSDAEVARVLGRVAFKTGNWTWAHSLLQESSRQMPDNPGVQYDFAWAAYSIGKLPEARQAMQRVVSTAAPTPESDDAKVFLALVPSENSAAGSAAAEAQDVLKTKPEYVPALMADAEARRARGDSKAAEEIYNRVLKQLPEFTPAMRELARIYSVDPANVAKAYDLATKARKTLGDDPELGRVLGTISYRKKDYTQAVQAFQQSARKKPLDAESMFYLGVSQINARQQPQGRQTLEQALAAGLNGPNADEARRLIQEQGSN